MTGSPIVCTNLRDRRNRPSNSNYHMSNENSQAIQKSCIASLTLGLRSAQRAKLKRKVPGVLCWNYYYLLEKWEKRFYILGIPFIWPRQKTPEMLVFSRNIFEVSNKNTKCDLSHENSHRTDIRSRARRTGSKWKGKALKTIANTVRTPRKKN